MRRLLTCVVVVLLLAACSGGRRYELRGQVLAIDRGRLEVTIKHEDIKGFMPGMTMPFKVRDARLLDGRAPGDLVTGTLVVEESEAYLSALTKTGQAPLAEAPAAHAFDLLDPGEMVPDDALIGQDGQTRRPSDWRGRTLIVTFIYTRCPLPDFCPRLDRNFAAAQRAIMADPRLAGRVHLLSVSFDPDYDTPAVLDAHAKRVGAIPATWTFATGEKGAIDRFAGRFGVSVIRGEQAMQEIVHNLRTAVIGGDGKLVTILNGNEWNVDELLQAARNATDGRQ